MTVIVERDSSQVELFRSALGDGTTVVASVTELGRHLQATSGEFAVVLGPSVDLESATALAERARIDRPSLGFILVRSRVDHEMLGLALRAGMRDVVEARDLTRLAEAVSSAYDVWRAMTAGSPEAATDADAGRLVTVFSTKGGVGKSTIATNLAAAFVTQKQRVCLVDLDIQNGDVAIMLQLFPNRTLADLHRMGGAVDTSVVDSLLTAHSSGLSVLVAPVQVDAMLQPDSVGRLLECLKAMYDVVVVDTSGSFDDYALLAIDHCDLLLLVGTLDIPALKSLKVATDTLDLLNVAREQWRLILNRADAKVGLSPGEFENALGMEISTSVPSSVEVPASINRGECLVLASPRHSVSQSIQNLAASLLASSPKAETGQAGGSHAETSRRGLLRRKVR